MNSNQISQPDLLTSWSTRHAFLILAGTLLTLISGQLWVLIIASLLSLIWLGLMVRQNLPASQVFTTANMITGVRGLLLLIMGIFYQQADNRLLALLGLIILLGDGLDGRIARQKNQVTPLGEYLDKETDAFFLHLFCLMGVFKDLLWQWVIFFGLLRYLFVIYLLVRGEKSRKERRFPLGRYIYVYTIMALLISFLPIPYIARPAIGTAGILLLYSFGRDFIWLFSEK